MKISLIVLDENDLRAFPVTGSVVVPLCPTSVGLRRRVVVNAPVLRDITAQPLAGLLLHDVAMEPEGKDRRGADDRRAIPRGGRRESDPVAEERARREQHEQQVVKFLRKQGPK
jgi:hypothetical protein